MASTIPAFGWGLLVIVVAMVFAAPTPAEANELTRVCIREGRYPFVYPVISVGGTSCVSDDTYNVVSQFLAYKTSHPAEAPQAICHLTMMYNKVEVSRLEVLDDDDNCRDKDLMGMQWKGKETFYVKAAGPDIVGEADGCVANFITDREGGANVQKVFVKALDGEDLTVGDCIGTMREHVFAFGFVLPAENSLKVVCISKKGTNQIAEMGTSLFFTTASSTDDVSAADCPNTAIMKIYLSASHSLRFSRGLCIYNSFSGGEKDFMKVIMLPEKHKRCPNALTGHENIFQNNNHNNLALFAYGGIDNEVENLVMYQLRDDMALAGLFKDVPKGSVFATPGLNLADVQGASLASELYVHRVDCGVEASSYCDPKAPRLIGNFMSVIEKTLTIYISKPFQDSDQDFAYNIRFGTYDGTYVDAYNFGGQIKPVGEYVQPVCQGKIISADGSFIGTMFALRENCHHAHFEHFVGASASHTFTFYTLTAGMAVCFERNLSYGYSQMKFGSKCTNTGATTVKFYVPFIHKAPPQVQPA